MQSRRIAPPLDLRSPTQPAQSAPKKPTISKKLVLKRVYKQHPKLKLNQLVAKAVTLQPKLSLREAEQYFKLRREQDRLAKEKDPQA